MAEGIYDVKLVRQGSLSESEDGSYNTLSSICLLKGPKNILINTGGSWEMQEVSNILSSIEIKNEHIDYVICTNSRCDQIGNLNMFPGATLIVGHDIQFGKSFINHHFHHKMPFEIDERVSIIPTPGRGTTDVTVLVNNGPDDKIAVVGDMILCEDEIIDDFFFKLWPIWDTDELLRQRSKILRKVHTIIPGRGKLFMVEERHFGPLINHPF